MRTLKKHLWAKFNMTPDEYRHKWGLPADYPMACKEFSEQRSAWRGATPTCFSKARSQARSKRSRRVARKTT